MVVDVAAAALSRCGAATVAVLLISGIAVAADAERQGLATGARRGRAAATSSVAPAPGVPSRVTSVFLVFLKIGALVFGSGYVLLAFLRADLVERLHGSPSTSCWTPWQSDK